MGKCILIGAGDLTCETLTVDKDDFVIAVDGGYAWCKKMQIVPDLIVGDLDSLTCEMREEIEAAALSDPEKLLRLPCEKDDTDMLFALKHGLAKGFLDFVLYGALGGRLEHTIANIQCLQFLKAQGASGIILDRKVSVFILQNETICFPKEKEGFFSLFALQKQVLGVTIKGMKYPLNDAVVTEDFPIGISNEFVGEASRVTVRNGTLLVIISEK